MSTTTKQRGFTLVETLLYAVGLLLLLGVIASLLYYVYGWYRDVTIAPRADRVGAALVDRIIKDIRTGNSINLSDSSLGVATGAISIESGTSSPITKRYAYSGGRVTYQEEAGTTYYATPADMSVSRFYFTHITTTVSEAIRVEVQITHPTREGIRTRSYNGLSILRHTYE